MNRIKPVFGFAKSTILTLMLILTCVLAVVPSALFGQVSASSSLSGDVTDPTGAVVPGADLQLTDVNTNVTQKTTTNQSGHYNFSSVPPGQYKLTVNRASFRPVSTNITISVGVNVAQNFRLEVGPSNTVVEVQATGQELQVTDASVGNVVKITTIESLPSLSHDVAAFLQLQPMTAVSYSPGGGVLGVGESNSTAGGVAGALADQNTFHLDGGDATSSTEGDGGYAHNQSGTGVAAVPTPAESVEEFRVTTNNSNFFARSAGADIQLVTRSGSNNWHGAAYEYNQNTDYNANQLQLKNEHLPRPVWQKNIFGARVGGPLVKDKAFFFLMFEEDRLKQGVTFSRFVPSALMRSGILQYRTTSGTIAQANFNPANGPLAANCVAGACDPRGLGISPIISQIWNKFEPAGNNPNDCPVGVSNCVDGLNTIGFDNTVPTLIHEGDGIARFDFNLSQKWSLNAEARYDVQDVFAQNQIDIGGITGGSVGVPHSTDAEPVQPRFFVIGLTGRLSPSLTNDFHTDFLRYFWQWRRRDPFPQVTGLGAALQIFQESNIAGMVPMNVDTQNARSRIWDGKDYNFTDEVSWLKGNHLLAFGGGFRHQNFFHIRNDKVVGGLAVPLYFAEFTNSDMVIDGAGFVPTNIDPTQITNWNKNYAAMMGMIDHTAQLLTRDPNLNPNPPGTPNTQRSLVDYYNLHIVDTWKVRPTLTLAYGIDWGVQTSPYETRGLQTTMVYGTNPHATVTYQNYMSQVEAAALKGQVFNPELGFAPIRTTGRKYPSDINWNDFAPRFSFAWNPHSGFMGNGNTVIRGGYGRYFDRLNGVGLVMTPALGIGFGNGVSCKGVTMTGACMRGVDPTNTWRIGPTSSGFDGENPPIPSLTTITPPVVPGAGIVPDGNSPYQLFDFRIDPHRKVGVEDTWTLGIQHQLPKNMVFEIGYVGRVGHHLYTTNDINQIPYMLTSGGQQFAQAYDAIQRQLFRGVAPGAVTPQPFFETLPAIASNYACTPGTCTATFVTAQASSFANADTTTIYDSMGLSGGAAGGPFDALPLDQQFLGTQISTSMGDSIYNAGYASIKKQLGKGLVFVGNYTYSHSSDDAGLAQQNVFISPTDGFDRRRDYETSYFDRRHTFTGYFVYDLPFGEGHTIGGGGGFLNRLIGGWRLSSTFTTSSGVPQRFTNCTYGDELGDGYLNICSSWVATGPAAFGTNHPHKMADGTINAFANPAAVFGSFRPPLFSDTLAGGQTFRGLHRFEMDSALSKDTRITERVSFNLYLQAINVLNHSEYNDPGMDLGTGVATFGQLTTQYNIPRFLNIGAKVTF